MYLKSGTISFDTGSKTARKKVSCVNNVHNFQNEYQFATGPSKTRQLLKYFDY